VLTPCIHRGEAIEVELVGGPTQAEEVADACLRAGVLPAANLLYLGTFELHEATYQTVKDIIQGDDKNIKKLFRR